MKVFIITVLFIFSTSCNKNQENNTISKSSIDPYKLGQTFKNHEYNKNIFDITTNENNLITTIILKSNKYKTDEGFGIGTGFEQLKKGKKKWIDKKLQLNKGTSIIGLIGDSIIYDNIMFVDSDKDEKVDFVWITSQQ